MYSSIDLRSIRQSTILHLSIYSAIEPSTNTSNHPSAIHRSGQSTSTHPSTYPFVNSYISNHPSAIHAFIHPLTHLPTHPATINQNINTIICISSNLVLISLTHHPDLSSKPTFPQSTYLPVLALPINCIRFDM